MLKPALPTLSLARPHSHADAENVRTLYHDGHALADGSVLVDGDHVLGGNVLDLHIARQLVAHHHLLEEVALSDNAKHLVAAVKTLRSATR